MRYDVLETGSPNPNPDVREAFTYPRSSDWPQVPETNQSTRKCPGLRTRQDMAFGHPCTQDARNFTNIARNKLLVSAS